MREIWQNIYIGLKVKYTWILSDFNETCVYLRIFEKYDSMKFIEYPSGGAELVHADGETDGQKLRS
jgi:hypothetical protein